MKDRFRRWRRATKLERGNELTNPFGIGWFYVVETFYVVGEPAVGIKSALDFN